MDTTDEAILAALRDDARASLSDLAAALRLSRTTVRARLARLQQSGEILGFTVVTRSDVRADPVRGLMMIEIEGRGADRITRTLAGMAALRAVHSTNGRWDVIVEIGTKTLEEFDEVLARIRKLDGVVASETSFCSRRARQGRPPPRPAACEMVQRGVRAAETQNASRTAQMTAFQPAMDRPKSCHTMSSHMTRPEGALVDRRSLPLIAPRSMPPPVQDDGPGQNFHSTPA